MSARWNAGDPAHEHLCRHHRRAGPARGPRRLDGDADRGPDPDLRRAQHGRGSGRERPRAGVDGDAARPAAAAARPHARPVRRGRRRRADADRDPLAGDGAAEAGRGRAPSRGPARHAARAHGGGAARRAERWGAVLAGDEGVLRLRARPADHRVAGTAAREQARGADQAGAEVGARAVEGQLARKRLRGAPGPPNRGAAAHALRHDRRRVAEGRSRQDDVDRAAGLAAGAGAARPDRGGGHEPGLRRRSAAPSRPSTRCSSTTSATCSSSPTCR